MSARFYSSALFVAILYSVLATFQNWIFAQIGYQMYTLESFPAWFLIIGGTYFLLTFVLLKYYRMKHYNVVFWAALGSALTILIYYVFIYISIMAWVSRAQTAGLFMVTVYVAFVASLIYAGTLAFSESGRRPWLKAAGIFMIIYFGILIATMVMARTASDASVSASIQKIEQWAGWLGGVWPLFFVVNF